MEESVFIKLPPVLHCAPKHGGNAEDALPVPTPLHRASVWAMRGGKMGRLLPQGLVLPQGTGWVIAPCGGGELGVNSARISAQGTPVPTALPRCHLGVGGSPMFPVLRADGIRLLHHPLCSFPELLCMQDGPNQAWLSLTHLAWVVHGMCRR